MDSARTTTTSCWFAARILGCGLALLGLIAHARAAQDPPVVGFPATLPGTPVPVPEGPKAIAWTVPIPAAPMRSPLIAGDLVFLAHLPGNIRAYHRSDGHEVWRAELPVEQPLDADGQLLLISSGEAIHALHAGDGTVAWRSPSGTATAPLLVKDGWIVAATAGKLTARRANDGETVWTVDAGVQRERGAISGDVLFTPLVDGRVVARNLLNGEVIWTKSLGGSPGEPFVLGEDLFVGASDKRFYSLDAASGEINWSWRVGADVRGQAASDGQRVFYTALDNLVRAVDRSDGAERWHKGVPFRPFAGPIATAGSVFVAGSSSEIRVFRASDGTATATIVFPARIGLNPGSALTEAGVIFAAVTGGLDESWKLSLSRPLR